MTAATSVAMKPVLILFASSHGQTRAIAMTIAHELGTVGLEVVVLNAETEPLPSPDAFELVVFGSRVHFGRHAPSIVGYVRQYDAILRDMPTALFSVSMSASGYLDAFVETLGWRPTIMLAIGGGIPYRTYNPILRLAMKQVAKATGHTTDTSKNHELTDWDRVCAFSDDLATLMKHRFTILHMPEVLTAGAGNAERVGMTTTLSARDVLEIVGTIDPHTLARVLALGATRDDLQEAANTPDGDSSDRVAALREILAEIAEIPLAL